MGKDVALAARQAAAASSAAAAASSSSAAAGVAACTLPAPVASFVETIFSEKMMKAQLEEQHIDLDKMPLGGISDVQVERGYATLRQLATAIATPASSSELQAQRLLALTNEFYNLIPHKFHRRDKPPVIDTT